MTMNTVHVTKLTYDDYVLIPEDLLIHEIIDGEHIASPAPNLYHQDVSRRIQFILYTQIELKGLGRVYDAPSDVELSRHDILQPDLYIVLREHQQILTKTRVIGSPDLVVEILSPSSDDRDRVLKFERYRAAGVPEYWIVDPREQTAEQFVLRQGIYESVPFTGIIRLTILDGVSVDFAAVWSNPAER